MHGVDRLRVDRIADIGSIGIGTDGGMEQGTLVVVVGRGERGAGWEGRREEGSAGRKGKWQ